MTATEKWIEESKRKAAIMLPKIAKMQMEAWEKNPEAIDNCFRKIGADPKERRAYFQSILDNN